jgi:hypothetical protein
MSNTTIQIKRSTSNNQPSSLNVGEPAYSFTSNVMFIGSGAGNGAFAVGGLHYVDKTNAAYLIANTSFDKANSANVLAYNTGIGANAFTSATISGANTAVGAGANAFTSAAFDKANSANILANAAYAAENITRAIAVAAYQNANSKFSSSGGTILGDVSIIGNISVSGNTSYINVSTFVVQDPLIYLAANNYVSDIVDIGFIGNYSNATGSNVRTGLLRDAGTKEYYVFQNYDGEPVDNHISPSSNNFALAVFNAHIRTSNLNLGGTNTIVWITSAYDAANAEPIAQTAFNKANSANVLAFNTGIGANAFTSATISGANTAVGAGANTVSIAAFAVANVAGGGTAAAFDKANSANVLAYNTGIGANTYLLATIAGANAAVGTGANTYLLATIAGANTAVGAGANDFTSATVAGANTAVGTGANTVGVAAFAKANSANYFAYLVDANTTAAFERANTGISNTENVVFTGNNFFFRSNIKFVGSTTRITYTSDSVYITNGAQTNKPALQLETGAGTGGIVVGRSTSSATFGHDSGNQTYIGSTNWGGLAFTTAGNLNHQANNGMFRFTGDANSYGASNGVIQVVAASSVGFYVRFTKDALTSTSNLRLNDVFTVSYSGNVNTLGSIESTGLKVIGSANITSNLLVLGVDVLNTMSGANTAVGTGANNFMIAVQNGSNTAVGAGANAFTSATISGANTAVGAGANTYAVAIGTAANSYMISTQNGSNTAVGAGANAFSSATITGANTAVGAGANAFASTVGTGANTYLLATISGANTAVGTGANAFTSATITGANTAVGTGANTYLLATIAGANTAVGTGANTVSVAAFAKANAALAINANGSVYMTDLNVSASALFGITSASVGFSSSGFTGFYFSGAKRVQIGSSTVNVNSGGSFNFSSDSNATTPDTSLFRDAANTLASRNGTAGQTYRVYGTYTDASNYERINITANSTAAYIQTENAGTGLARPLYLGSNNATAVTIATSGNVGIGITTPTATLHVVGTANITSNLIVQGADVFQTIAGANTAVGAGANTYLLATISGANTAVGTGANTVSIAAFAVANAAGGGSGASMNVDSVNATRYIIFADSVSGTLTRANVSRGMSFNPSSNNIYVSGNANV